MAVYQFPNAPFVLNPSQQSWAINGPFPQGTSITEEWTGANVNAPCGAYGYAASMYSADRKTGTPEARFNVSTSSASLSWTTPTAFSALVGAFFTDSYCSSGIVGQVTVTIVVPATTPCIYGTEPQPLAQFVYYLTPGLIDLWLGTVGMPWLAPVFTALWFTSINTQDLCAAGPPAVPTIDLSTLESSIATSTQLLKAVAWPNLCQCIPGTPAPIPPPSPTQPEPIGWPTPPVFGCTNTDICAALQQMQAQLQALQRALGDDLGLTTLLQRYRLPFAYVPGAAHSNLVNSGSFVVDRLVGLDVEITDISSEHRHLFGNPPYVWQVGWVSVSDGGGMLQERRLTRQRFTWFPQSMELAMLVGWAVSPDVTLRITELQAET